MTSQGLFGAGQGSQGVSQGYQGAQEGLTNGSSTGMQRAASGGMTPNPSTNTQRNTMGFNIGTLAPLVSMIPGWGPIAGGLMSAVGGMQQQGGANSAAMNAQGAQTGALAGASGIAGQLAGPPDYSGIVKAEQSGVNSLKAGVGGVANPNAVVGQMQGNNIGNAISGANQNQDARLQAAAGIEQGNASQYNTIGQQAGAAAQAQGNPFSLFSNALSGAGGLGGILGGSLGGGGMQTTSSDPVASTSGAPGPLNAGILNPGATATYK